MTRMYGPAVRCKSLCRDSGERDIDADYGDRAIECSRHGVLLVFGVPDQLPSLAGQEHGRTIPLAETGSVDGKTTITVTPIQDLI